MVCRIGRPIEGEAIKNCAKTQAVPGYRAGRLFWLVNWHHQRLTVCWWSCAKDLAAKPFFFIAAVAKATVSYSVGISVYIFVGELIKAYITRRVFCSTTVRQFWAAESCTAVWVLRGSLLQAVLTRGDFLNTEKYRSVVGSLITISLEIYCRICQWKSFENRLRFEEWVWCLSVSEHSVHESARGCQASLD